MSGIPNNAKIGTGSFENMFHDEIIKTINEAVPNSNDIIYILKKLLINAVYTKKNVKGQEVVILDLYKDDFLMPRIFKPVKEYSALGTGGFCDYLKTELRLNYERINRTTSDLPQSDQDHLDKTVLKVSMEFHNLVKNLKIKESD